MKKKEIDWFVIVNRFAGSGKTVKLWNKAERLLRGKGVKFTVATTGNGYNVTKLTQKAAEEGQRAFIAVGGDGTAHDVLDGIMASITKAGSSLKLSDFTLAVIPIGSGNDWIKSHGLSHDLDLVTDLISAQSFSKQDIVKASCWDGREMEGEPEKVSYMLNVGGVAFDANICKRVNTQKKQGKTGKALYVRALFYILFRSRFYDMEIEADGRNIFRGRMFSVAFGVGRYSGGGMRQVPEAVMDDGLLDVTLIPSDCFPAIVFHAYKLFTSRFLTVPRVIASKIKDIVIKPHNNDLPATVEVDGEILGRLPVKMEVLPDQLTVLHKDSKKNK